MKPKRLFVMICMLLLAVTATLRVRKLHGGTRVQPRHLLTKLLLKATKASASPLPGSTGWATLLIM